MEMPDKKELERMADNLESFMSIVDRYIIIDGLTKKEYDESKSVVEELIGRLRGRKPNGKKCKRGKGVFDEERYREYVLNGKDD